MPVISIASTTNPSAVKKQNRCKREANAGVPPSKRPRFRLLGVEQQSSIHSPPALCTHSTKICVTFHLGQATKALTICSTVRKQMTCQNRNSKNNRLPSSTNCIVYSRIMGLWYNHKPRRAGFQEYLPSWIVKLRLKLYGHAIWNTKPGVNHSVDS